MYKLFYKCEKKFNQIELLKFNEDYISDEQCLCFGQLSKTNIFIGENNSGKSRFLRYLFQENYNGFTDEGFQQFHNDTKSNVYSYYETPPSSYAKIFINAHNKFKNYAIDTYDLSRHPFWGQCFKNSVEVHNESKYYFPIIRGVKDYKSAIIKKLKKVLSDTVLIQNKDSINHFISILDLDKKGLEDFDIYNKIILNEYFKDSRNLEDRILTGGKLYSEIKKLLLGDNIQRKLIENFQQFLHDNFFRDVDKIELIPNEEKKILYVRIGDDEREIFNLGDGIQQLIIILFSLYYHKDEQNCMFFIEEPELYLHPGILRKFIEVINSDIFKNHQYFITTHSNAILDMSADVEVNMSIFKFKKEKEHFNDKENFLIEQCNNGDMSLLNELGIRNSSVFLSNCSIWVEGITDRLYLRHYLKLYEKKFNKHFRENIDFTFVEYGGGNLVHFNFDDENTDDINAKYINNNIFLIADNDNRKASSKKQQHKEHLKAVLGENFYELPVVEIENLIHNQVLTSVLISDNQDKEEIIKTKLSNKDFSTKQLGKYIDTLFKDDGLKSYSGSSGTIKNKLKFCNEALNFTTDYDMLSTNAKELTEKIVKFIESHNR